MFTLKQVPPNEIEEVWPAIEKRWEGKEYLWEYYETMDFVKYTLMSNLRMLWLLEKNGRVVMTLVTQVVPRQTCRVFQIIMCEGDDVAFALTLLEAVERLAAEAECEWVEVQMGRSGWSRLLKEQGYTEVYRVCAKRTHFHGGEGRA